MTIAAVVVAAGQGTRFGGPKQFSLFEGQTVAARSVRATRTVATYVGLAVPDNYKGDGRAAGRGGAGGSARAPGVRAGPAPCLAAEVVVVQDAARPLAS